MNHINILKNITIMFDGLFTIIKENLDIITKGKIFRDYLFTFLKILFLYLFLMFILIFIGNKYELVEDKYECENKTASGFTIKGECDTLYFSSFLNIENHQNNTNNQKYIKNSISLFTDFIKENFSNVILVILLITIVYHLILPPNTYEDFLNRIYFYLGLE